MYLAQYIYIGSAFPEPWQVVPCAGQMQLMEPLDFVQGIFPQAELELNSESDDQPTAVCILCNADFDRSASLAACNHWIPGWIQAEIEDAEGGSLSDKWATEFEDLETAKQVALSDQLDFCTDAAIAESLEFEIDRCQRRIANFQEMQQDLATHGLVCRNVVSDGNCGIDMLLRFQSSPSCSDDLRSSFASLRERLKSAWVKSTQSVRWRILWHQLCMGRNGDEPPADEGSAANEIEQASGQPAPEQLQNAEGELPSTPPKKPPKDECPFTPDPVDKKNQLVPSEPSDPAANGVLVIPGEGPPKKRRTGKIDIKNKINFEQYFEHFLADRGITYKQWLSLHAESIGVVQLG